MRQSQAHFDQLRGKPSVRRHPPIYPAPPTPSQRSRGVRDVRQFRTRVTAAGATSIGDIVAVAGN